MLMHTASLRVCALGQHYRLSPVEHMLSAARAEQPPTGAASNIAALRWCRNPDVPLP